MKRLFASAGAALGGLVLGLVTPTLASADYRCWTEYRCSDVTNTWLIIDCCQDSGSIPECDTSDSGERCNQCSMEPPVCS